MPCFSFIAKNLFSLVLFGVPPQCALLNKHNEIEKIKSRKFHTAKKISAMILVAFIILGWFSYFVKHASFPEFRASFRVLFIPF